MDYFVYLLECSDGSLYVGSTNNVERRLTEHQAGQAAVWTSRRLPVKLLFTENHPTRISALQREKELKGWSQKKKKQLVEETCKKNPVVIIVSGAPGSGKTTLAQAISQRYSIPVIHKDAIKEKLFDTLGWSNREWSKKIGAASIQLLYLTTESLLQAGQSCILENNFRREYDSQHFADLQKRYGISFIEILCPCDPDMTIDRFQKRITDNRRHPGHVESDNSSEFQQMIREWKTEPMTSTVDIFSIDTSSNFDTKYSHLFNQLDPLLKKYDHSLGKTGRTIGV